jgi:cold-inducible RNA-binding protein
MNDQNKIFISNLVYSKKEDEIRELFEPFGTISSISIPPNKDNPSLSRGFAFVTFESPEAVQEALSLNGTEVDGRTMTVNVAKAREESRGGGNRGGGFGGSGGGGYRRR